MNVLIQVPVIQSLLPIIDLREVLDELKKRIKGGDDILKARSDKREMTPSPHRRLLAHLPDLCTKVIVYQLL